MGLLNLEYRESSHYCTSCTIGGTVCVCQLNTGRARTRHIRRLHKLQFRWPICACQENLGQVNARGVRRLHKLQHWRYTSCLPGEPRSNEGSRYLKTAQAAASAASSCLPGKPRSSKGPRRSETAQASESATQFVPTRRTQVDLRPEALRDCTSFIIGGPVRTCQENLCRVKARGVRRLHKLHYW